MSNQKVTSKKLTAATSNITFKGGLRNINLKYARPNSAYKPPEQWCVTALAAVSDVWVGACTGSENADSCVSCGSIRSIKNLLAHHIGDSELLYVMNAYIYGVTNTASLADALHLTHDYENYITNTTALTSLQKNILSQGFRGFTKKKKVTKRRGEKEG